MYENIIEIGRIDPARRLAWKLADTMRLEPAFQRAEANHTELADALRSGIRIRAIATHLAQARP